MKKPKVTLEKRVEAELRRVKKLLRERTEHGDNLYGAQQALAWLADPEGTAAPSRAFVERS